jgi:DNA polymerase sigma
VQSTFDAATSGQTAALTQFLGSATSGGFLQAATNAMNGLLDPVSGVLAEQITSVTANIASTNSQIAEKEAAVTQLQNTLTQQMAAADTLIYGLQQQATEIEDMLTAEQDSNLQGTTA